MITAIVAPCGRLSRPITSACLEAARDLGRLDFFPSSRFNRLLVVVCAFVLETCLVLAILVTSHRLRRQMTPSAPKPRGGQTALAGVEEKQKKGQVLPMRRTMLAALRSVLAS